jgi:hypothetical protein
MLNIVEYETDMLVSSAMRIIITRYRLAVGVARYTTLKRNQKGNRSLLGMEIGGSYG